MKQLKDAFWRIESRLIEQHQALGSSHRAKIRPFSTENRRTCNQSPSRRTNCAASAGPGLRFAPSGLGADLDPESAAQR
jgi:hypothetical protein